MRIMEVSEAVIKAHSGEYDVESVRRLRVANNGIRRMAGVAVCMNLVELSLPGNQVNSLKRALRFGLLACFACLLD